MMAVGKRTINEQIGYAPAARLLIVNADDFGMCHANNAAILHAWQQGIVSSTSLMVPCPWAPHAMRLLAEHPTLPFAVHLTLISEFGDYRWGPVASKSLVPSLLDDDGFFYRYNQQDALLAVAHLDEVETEFRAQLDAVRSAGLTPSHLDWHCLADGGREDIFQLTLSLARESGLALRIHHQPHAEVCRRLGLPVPDHSVLDSYGLETEGKAARYAQLLRDLPSGLSEWAVHPSLGDVEAQAIEPGSWDRRRADFDFVLSHHARDIIEEEGIIALDFRALQAVWSRGSMRGEDRAAGEP